MTHPLAYALADAGLVRPMYRHVEPSYPWEGCGFVFADGDGTLTLLPTVNRAQQLFERDPERYPRGAADWFEPDMKPWLRAVRDGWTPRLIFHSHPDVGAYFSEGDHASAVYEDDGGGVQERNPGVLHLVVSVRQGTADGAVLFAFAPADGVFVAVGQFDADGNVVAEAAD